MTWHTLYQHEFQDRNLNNSAGAPGRLVSSTPRPNVKVTGLHGMALLPGRWFGVNFSEPVEDVIGLDIVLKVHAPANTGTVALCNVGNIMNLDFLWDSPSNSAMVDGELIAFGELRVKVGPSTLLVPNVGLPHRRPTDIHVNWHNSGQCRVEVGGKLTAYDPIMSPGQTFVATNVRFGNPTAAPAARPRHFLHDIHIRCIRNLDSLSQILTELSPGLEEVPNSERCQVEAERHFRSILEIIRQFMRLFTQQETQHWNSNMAAPQQPFSRAAADAHTSSMESLLSAMEFLTGSGDEHREAFLESIRRLFETLHAALPSEFQQMIVDLESLSGPSQSCLDAGAELAERYEEIVQPFVDLANRTIEIAKEVAASEK